MNEIYHDTGGIILPDLSDLESDITVDTLINELSNLQRPKGIKFTKIFWEYLQYALISLMMLGFVLLILWLKCCKGKSGLTLCMAPMGNCKIRQADKNQKAGQAEDEAVAPTSTRSADSQPREVQRKVADTRSVETLTLGLTAPEKE